MINKLLLNFKNETFDKIMLMYLGSRFLQPTLTKVSLISSIIENTLRDSDYIIYDKNYSSYDSKQVYILGTEKIKQSFTNLLNIKSDFKFLEKIIEIDSLLTYKNQKNFVEKVVQINFNNIVSNSDLPILSTVIFPEAEYECDNNYKVFVLDNFKDYWVVEEMNSITRRYELIKRRFEYFDILTKFIFKQIHNLGLNIKFDFSVCQTKDNNSYDSLEFYFEFFTELEAAFVSTPVEIYRYLNLPKTIDIYAEFSNEEMSCIKEFTIPKIAHSPISNEYKFYNIKSNYYLYLLIEDDLRKIILTSLDLDLKQNIDNFFNSNSEHLYYKKSFLEKVCSITKKENISYSSMINTTKL